MTEKTEYRVKFIRAEVTRAAGSKGVYVVEDSTSFFESDCDAYESVKRALGRGAATWNKDRTAGYWIEEDCVTMAFVDEVASDGPEGSVACGQPLRL